MIYTIEVETKQTSVGENEINSRQPRRARMEGKKEALLISKGGVSYTDLLKKVKGEMINMNDVNPVDKIRMTNRGDLMIETNSYDIQELGKRLGSCIDGENLSHSRKQD